MSGPRSHRSPKIRFFLYGVAVCFVATTFYVYKLKQDHIDFQQRCRAEQSTLSAQLRAVIDYRERMQHSLTAARSQHADAITALHTQQEEQSKLTKNHILIQSLYNNLTQECTKLKSTAKADRDQMETYKNQQEESASNYQKLRRELDDKTFTTNVQIEMLKNENMKMKQEVQQLTEMNAKMQVQPNPPYRPDVSYMHAMIYDANKNINKQSEISPDVYLVKITMKPEKSEDDPASVAAIPPENNQASVSPNNNSVANKESINREGRSSETLRAEIPQGVLPELPVDMNSNDKPPNHRPDDKSENKIGRPPNRYKIKLTPEENNLMPGDNDKSANQKNYHFEPDKSQEFNKNVNIDNLNDVESKFEPEEKEGDIDNEPHNNHDNREPVGAQIDDEEEYRIDPGE